jgi:glycosyltransferase involved in cell wall biosynthesis
MKISIIVPAFNEEKLIASCLAAIRESAGAFADRGWECEFVVCDNNSTDRTADLARAAGATVVFEPENQIARARNRGASVATGDWLVFVDADSHPTRALFAELAAVLAGGRVLGGGCLVRMEGIRPAARFLVGVWNWISRLRRWAAGSFVFCDAAAFRKIGGFSQELFAAEEIDFSQRLKRHAREQGRTVRILTRHPLRTSSRKTELYSPAEQLRIVVKALLRPRRTLTRREECVLWYDGRR